jgi:hypothetical protein
MIVAAVLMSGGQALGAQQQDSTKAGISTTTKTRRPPVHRDSVAKPPIPPGRAFLYSLLVPGLGQAKLDRPVLAAMFFSIEVVSIVEARQAAIDLAYAHRHHNDAASSRDSVIGGKVVIDTSTGLPISIPQYNPYSSDRVNARGVHLEDWIAALIFNHLISGADAFVAANLWDLPSRVTAFRGSDGSTVVAFSLPLRAPPL